MSRAGQRDWHYSQRLSIPLTVFLLLVSGRAHGQAPSAAVTLSPVLADWRAEIEALGKRQVLLARVFTDRRSGAVRLPQDAPERAVIVEYLKNTNFLNSFLATHAVTIHHRRGEETLHFVLLNMARQAEWAHREESVIAQEFGRILLQARNYPMPAYEAKYDSCLAMQAGDLVQRQVIRGELERRGIEFNSYWLPLLEIATEEMEASEVTPTEDIPTCALMSKLVLWVDALAGVEPADWPQRDRFLAALRRSYPILNDTATYLNGLIRRRDLNDQAQYQAVMQETLDQFYGFVKAVLKRGGGIQYEIERVPPSDVR